VEAWDHKFEASGLHNKTLSQKERKERRERQKENPTNLQIHDFKKGLGTPGLTLARQILYLYHLSHCANPFGVCDGFFPHRILGTICPG
jgi:hypothetical protein